MVKSATVKGVRMGLACADISSQTLRRTKIQIQTTTPSHGMIGVFTALEMKAIRCLPF